MESQKKIEIREIQYGSAEYRSEVDLRQRVLRTPLALVFTPEFLAQDEGHFHLGAFRGTTLIGCLVLVPDDQIVKMRQVAVASEAQGSGAGGTLVTEAERFAKQKGFTSMVLNARETAIPFYIKHGYEIFDEPFTEVGLPHRKMRKRL